MTTRLPMHLSLRLLCAAVLGTGGAGCAISDARDGIGRWCSTDAACPIDYFCQLEGAVEDEVDVAEGRCAPVLDYGSTCPQPSWPIRAGKTLEGDQEITRSDDLVRFDGVTAVAGDLELRDAEARLLALGDLCGIAGLQRVSGQLRISETDVESLDGLQAVASVVAGLVVVDNASLVDVMALANLQFAPPPLDVGNASVLFARNANLPPDAVAALAAALEPAGIDVFECQNRGAATPCPAAVTAYVDRR